MDGERRKARNEVIKRYREKNMQNIESNGGTEKKRAKRRARERVRERWGQMER